MSDKDLIQKELVGLLEEAERRKKYCKFSSYFPDSGPFDRSQYKKHVEFMNQGAKFNQRAFVAANRTGKTVTGAYEMTCHLTGLYPKWWKGRTFSNAVTAWAASKSNQVTKEVIQAELLGSMMDVGSGMIPKELIIKCIKKPGVAEAIETVFVKHVAGGISELTFKSYDQGRETFQGTKRQVIWLDEEPADYGIFSESLTRTAGAGDGVTDGIVYCTFTPLFGLSQIVLSFLEDGKFPEGGTSNENPYKYVTNVSWDEVPHLTDSWKESTLGAYSEHDRKARSEGIPALGAGAVYTISEENFVVDPFAIPLWWPRAYGMDFGWNHPTAVVWAAQDPDSGIMYLYSEHSLNKTTPPIHAEAIKQRGVWIEGSCDPAGGGSSQRDGTRLIDEYQLLGLEVSPSPGGNNSKEARISKVRVLLESGQLKVMNHLAKWLSEYRVYRYNERGELVKKNDDLQDATQYLICEFNDIKQLPPDPDAEIPTFSGLDSNRDAVTGY